MQKGPENNFTPNELEKFELIFQAHINGNQKRVATLMKKLTPREEDRYDLYLRAAEIELAEKNTPSITHGRHIHAKATNESSKSDEEVSSSSNKKKPDGKCSIQ